VSALYLTHYRSLVRLAALLVPDLASAEEIVQDSFAALHCAWLRMAETHDALGYLRRSVVSRSRSEPRPRGAMGKRVPDGSAAGREAGLSPATAAFVSAL
jgi:DNA-directed RNA polymerase specialized sigma24 family protein